jgi:sensor histidine kinase YesM
MTAAAMNNRKKILAHIGLIVIFAVIAAQNLNISSADNGMTVVFAVFFMFISIVYLNIYVLVPRFLLKNKLWHYFLGLILSIVLFLILMGFLVQFVSYFSNEVESNNMPAYFTIVLLFAMVVKLGFVVAGTSVFLLFWHWNKYKQRIDELENVSLQSELEQLKNQINPHFLFNMLNNVNIMVREDPDAASDMLMKLNDLLHYQINDSAKERVYLAEDIAFLTDFLELEKTRRDRFDYTLLQTGDTVSVQVPPLLFIPFLENAVKHSADSENDSYVRVNFAMQDGQLSFVCENSKPAHPAKKKVGGLGLKNIQRRLDLLFEKNYSLELLEQENSYTVNLEIKL